MANKRIAICVDKNWKKNITKKFPYKSMYQITKELNEQLEETMYGLRSKKKR